MQVASPGFFSFFEAKGEMTEWTKVQHWKCCVRASAPGVRIPLSPPFWDKVFLERWPRG